MSSADTGATQLASVAERRRALRARHGSWREMTLAGALDAAAERHPERPLILSEARSLAYRDVVEASRALAAGLIARGVRPGDHVALVLPNRPELVVLTFALARIGAVAVPVNYLLRRDELAYVLAQSDASLLVTEARFRDLDYLSALDEIAPGWEEHGGGERLPQLREVIVIGDQTDRPRRAAGYEECLAEAPGEELLAELARYERAADPQATADIIYTSGTSGRPKGVVLSHDALLRSAYGSAWTRAFQDGRRILFALPLYHVFAFVEGLLASLFADGAIIPQAQFDPVATLRAIELHRAHEALFVPTMTIAVLEAARRERFDLGSLHAVMSAAAPAPVRLWQEVRDELGVTEIVTAYGMTETSAATTFTQPDGPLELVATTVGTPKYGDLAGDPALGGHLVAYRTVDPLSGAELPAGSEGELAARGPIVTRGYYEKPQETAAAIDADGWLRSGDLGRIGEEGLALTGRSKELYKCGGELVAPKEVEECLTAHAGVAQAYVVGVPDERMGEVGCAFVVPTTDPGPTAEELIAHCRGRLARFKVPVHVIPLPAAELPTTSTGKVKKFVLIDRATAALDLA